MFSQNRNLLENVCKYAKCNKYMYNMWKIGPLSEIYPPKDGQSWAALLNVEK